MRAKIGIDLFGKPCSINDGENDALVLHSGTLGQFLFHREPSIRVATLSLLIMAPSTKKPMSSVALKAILSGLPFMHADTDSQSRGEILSLIRKLMVRIRGAQACHENSIETELSETQAFLIAYVKFLESEMRSSASYQRRITALRSLYVVLNTGVDPRVNRAGAVKVDREQAPWRYNLDILSPKLFRLLLNLLLDPFNDVREISQSILELFPHELLVASVYRSEESYSIYSPHLIDVLSRAEALAGRTRRADHADAVARLYHVIFSLSHRGSSEHHWHVSKAGVAEAILEKLEGRLTHAGGFFNPSMRDAPIHGHVSALRLVATFHLTAIG